MSEEVEVHILRRFNLVKKVGSGAYGHVWKATERKTGELVALKKIFDAFQHSTDAQRTYREIVFLHQLEHPNIIKLHEVIKAENDKDLYLIFEYMEADLHNAISQKILKDIHNRFIMYQLLKGIKFLHSAQLIHRDLKPSNILLNSDCILKICDFGLARSLGSDVDGDVVLTEQVATRWYRSPQVLLGSQTYDKSADVWSIGCILAEIIIGKPIFPGNSTLNQLERILSFTGKPKKQDIMALNSEIAYTMIESINEIKKKNISEWFKPQVPQDAINLLQQILQFNPHKRITVQQILEHPYLAKFHNPKEEYESKKIINPPISDNTKLNLKQYRHLIYERIKQVYHQQPTQNDHRDSTISNQPKSIPKRESFKNNPNTNENPIKQNCNITTKNSIHQSSTPKQRPSSTALRQNTLYTANNQTTVIQRQNKIKVYQNLNQDQKLKKKNSLKQMLKNKKATPSVKEEYSNTTNFSQMGYINNVNRGYSASTSFANINKYYKHNHRDSYNINHKPSFTKY